MSIARKDSGGDDPEFPETTFAEVRALLLERAGFDLGHYKDGCARRRVARRARTCRCDGATYVQRLRDDPAEAEALLAALTIHVSQFFRNPSTFDHLRRQVLPALIERARRTRRGELRLWCAGCAGGEEPYSLALLAQELAPPGLSLSLLATDLSPVILERAREGFYEPARLAQVPEELRERYFRAEGQGFRLDREIRRMVRFRRQDLLAPGEYPRADLILCRNVLIYFSRPEQERIVDRFAQALPPGGFLVIGRAENLFGAARERFHGELPRERIYRRLEDHSASLPQGVERCV